MEIYAKSRLNNYMYDKMKKGADAIEVHLDSDYEDELKNLDKNIVKSVPIRVVHMPLYKGYDTQIESKPGKKALRDTCELASEISKIQGHNILIVCHLETSIDLLKRLGLYDELVDNMKAIAEECPMLEFAIENVPLLKISETKLGFRAVSDNAPIQLVKDINHPRVGTCLDICHALMNLRLEKYMLDYLSDIDLNKTVMEVEKGLSFYFKAYKDTIKLIHLATANAHGWEHDHGLPFEREDKKFLKGIIDLYEIYGYDVPITIEVREEDYSNGVNFEKTNLLLREVLKERKK